MKNSSKTRTILLLIVFCTILSCKNNQEMNSDGEPTTTYADSTNMESEMQVDTISNPRQPNGDVLDGSKSATKSTNSLPK